MKIFLAALIFPGPRIGGRGCSQKKKGKACKRKKKVRKMIFNIEKTPGGKGTPITNQNL